MILVFYLSRSPYWEFQKRPLDDFAHSEVFAFLNLPDGPLVLYWFAADNSQFLWSALIIAPATPG